MNLLEHEGKQIFSDFGIPVPKSKLITPRTQKPPFTPPFILKSQVPVSDRGRRGGIQIVKSTRSFSKISQQLFRLELDNHQPRHLLAEQLINPQSELYLSISYSTDTRSPVLAINKSGGVGTLKAHLTPIDPLIGLPAFLIRQAIAQAGLKSNRNLEKIISQLWQIFIEKKALLVEINPLFHLADDTFLAGDSKIILDDNIENPGHRPFINLGGDIAILASGGGASMINLDVLMRAGGKPANYVEYSGNPKGDVVRDLTTQVLAQPNLKGCWVVGGTANFTDIYETMKGFLAGLDKVKPKPTYPIVIRRDGPRQVEAFQLLKQTAQSKNYNFHLYGPEISMAKSAQIMVDLAYQTKL